MHTRCRRVTLILAFAAAISGAPSGFSLAQSPGPPPEPQTTSAPGGSSSMAQAFQELFQISQKERRGLMFFLNGQTVGGAVVRLIGNDAVEIRNQTYGRIIIRLDRIDAVAMN